MDVELVKRKEYEKEDFYKNRKIIYGGFKGEMSWDYYLTGFEKELHVRLDLIRTYVKIFMSDMIDQFKNTRFPESTFFLFDDNYAISFTERSWGDFMAAVTGKKNYRDFYGIEYIQTFN